MKAAKREIVLDAIRGFSILGIIFVNIAYFASPAFDALIQSIPNGTSLTDSIARFVTTLFFTGKFYPIFAFAFGIGIAIMEISNKSGKYLFWRFIILILMGILHSIFLSTVDILLMYGVIALLFLNIRKLPDATRKAILIGSGLLSVMLAIFSIFLGIGIVLVDMFLGRDFITTTLVGDSSRIGQIISVFTGTNIIEMLLLRSSLSFEYIASGIFTTGPIVLTLMLAGYEWYKAYIKRNDLTLRQFIVQTIQPYIGVIFLAGIILNILAAIIAILPFHILGTYSIASGILMVFGPLLSIVYISIIINTPIWVKNMLAPIGRMTLSVYIFQSITMTIIFTGIGLGLFGKVTDAGLLVIAAVISVITIPVFSLLGRFVDKGPIESLWRKGTEILSNTK
jgi:uncharacterized protein